MRRLKTTSNNEEPFWFRPPWSLLIDVLRLNKLDPWNIDLEKLIYGFLNKMLSLNLVNFKVSGLALLSAAIIHRIKTELILKIEDEEEENSNTEEEKETIKLLPPIIPPFRQVKRKVSIKELMIALEKALEQELTPKKRPIRKLSLRNIEALTYEIDMDRTEIERKISQIYEKIKELSEKSQIIRLTQILPKDYSRMELVRTLFCILQLGCRGKIDIWQEKPFEEIFLKLVS